MDKVLPDALADQLLTKMRQEHEEKFGTPEEQKAAREAWHQENDLCTVCHGEKRFDDVTDQGGVHSYPCWHCRATGSYKVQQEVFAERMKAV